MDSRRKEIEHLDSEITRLEQQITHECIEIGRRVASADPRDVRDAELLKYLNSVQTLRRSIDSFRGDIEKTHALGRQIDALVLEIDENDRRRAELDHDRRSKFIEIGAGSFSVFKSLPDREPYRDAFEDILKLDLEMERLHADLKALEAEELGKGFFERLRLKGRKVLLRGELSRLDRGKSAAYELSAEKILDSDFARRTEGPLRRLFDFATERGLAADALAEENDSKVERIEALRLELKRLLGASERPEDKAKEIGARIDGLHKELDVMHCWTGQIFLERDLRSDFPDEALAAKYEIVTGLRESIHRKRLQAYRLKAEIEIEEITHREKEKRARRKQIEEDMRVKERQIGVIDIEINLDLRRLEELKRVLTGEAPYVQAPPLPPGPDLYPPPPPPAPR